jgi:preprotein translocase subunit SecD
MTIRGEHGKRHFCSYAVLSFVVLAIIFINTLTAAGLSGDQTGKHTLELRLASHEKIEGWQRVPGPQPQNIPLWISPEIALSNRDIARAYVDRTLEGKPCVGIILTEEGSLKLARLTKSHIGEILAIILDGRVTSVPKIMSEITYGRAIINGEFTEESAGLLAKALSVVQTGKPKSVGVRNKFEPGKHKFELRLASYQKVEGWERVLGPEPQNAPLWVSPEVALSNRDVARAYPERTAEGKPCVGFLLTEDGALKLARLTKSHIGELLAIILDGRVDSVPKIMGEFTGGRAMILGNFTEEETRSIAKGIMMK